MSNRSCPVIEPVISQHAEDAAFLWLLRDDAVRAPHYLLWELAKLDDRVEAHLDGLRVAAGPGWEIVKQQLVEVGEPGEVFASAVLAFESGMEDRVRDVLKVGTATPETARALVSVLGWLPYALAEKPIQSFLVSESPGLRRVGLAAAAAHRKVPREGLLGALNDRDPAVRARALRAAGELGQVVLQPVVRKQLQAADPVCRFWAAWSAARLANDPEAVAALQRCAVPGNPFGEPAVGLAVRRLPIAVARGWHKTLAQNPALARLSVAAAGSLGLPELVPWLIERMKVPELARVAGEAFGMLTGVDIAYEDLDGEKPEGFESGPTENPEDENVAMDPDENLPWPEPTLIQKWWSAHRGNFQKGTRHLLGQPIEPESLLTALKIGRQRQRAAAALELALIQPSQPLFEVRAPGPRQVKALGTGRSFS